MYHTKAIMATDTSTTAGPATHLPPSFVRHLSPGNCFHNAYKSSSGGSVWNSRSCFFRQNNSKHSNSTKHFGLFSSFTLNDKKKKKPTLIYKERDHNVSTKVVVLLRRDDDGWWFRKRVVDSIAHTDDVIHVRWPCRFPRRRCFIFLSNWRQPCFRPSDALFDRTSQIRASLVIFIRRRLSSDLWCDVFCVSNIRPRESFTYEMYVQRTANLVSNRKHAQQQTRPSQLVRASSVLPFFVLIYTRHAERSFCRSLLTEFGIPRAAENEWC